MSVAMGNFDGLHIGHKAVINMAKPDSDAVKFGVLTFEPHPRQFFSPGSAPFRLMSKSSKSYELKLMGLDTLIEIPFNSTIARLEPKVFIETLLFKYFRLSNIVVGEDFKFGFQRKGDANLLKQIGKTFDIKVIIAPLVKTNDSEISSTAIRKALSRGNPKKAKQMLGRWYSIIGSVLEGDKRGRLLGFPTINLELDNIHLPKFGVYSAIANVLTGRHKGSYMAAASIGERPTYGKNRPNLEVHLLNFSGNLYFEKVAVSLVAFQRPEIKFNSSNELIKQMKKDCYVATKTLKNV